MCPMEPMHSMPLGLIWLVSTRATMVSLTSAKQQRHRLPYRFHCSCSLDLPHKIFRNLCRSEGIFWNIWTRQSTGRGRQSCWCGQHGRWARQAWWGRRGQCDCQSKQDCRGQRGHLVLLYVFPQNAGSISNRQPTGSHYWKEICCRRDLCVHLLPDGRHRTSCLYWEWTHQSTERWDEFFWEVDAHVPTFQTRCMLHLSQVMIASLLWLSMLLLLNCFGLLKLRAQMPKMQRHGVKLLVLKMFVLLPQESDPY